MAVARQPYSCVHHNNCQCVEVVSPFGFATALGLDLEAPDPENGMIVVRNAKDKELPDDQRPQVSFTREEWDIFLQDARKGNFDLPSEEGA